jgi:hypothetical protein
MRIRPLLFAAAILLLLSVPGVAQGLGDNCDLSGTWYGGSDPHFQYLWSNTPVGAGRYYSSIQLGFDYHQLGYVHATPWAGETIKTGSKTFDVYGISYWLWDPAAAALFDPGIDPSLPEVDIVRSRVTLIDCNTMTNTVDVYGAYFNFTPGTTPFVTPVDMDFLPNGPITETYHRMPTTLAGLQPAVAAATVSAAPAFKPPARPEAVVPDSKKRR